MINVGFIVEGLTEYFLLKSASFNEFLSRNDIRLVNVINEHRITLFCCLLLIACTPRPSTASLYLFTGDSGYITMEQLFPYVLQNKIIDTTASEGRWRDIPAQDTFGKYYRYKDGYIACVVNVNPPFESLVLFQTDANGQVENIQPYYHGNYCNCWNGSFGFGKIKDYFFVRICGTGTAFTSSTLHVFRELGKQSEGQEIYEYLWSGSMTDPDAYNCTELSTLQLDNNEIHASYVELEGNRKNKASEKKNRHFEINYTLTNGAWTPDDSISLYSN